MAASGEVSREVMIKDSWSHLDECATSVNQGGSCSALKVEPTLHPFQFKGVSYLINLFSHRLS
jgi:hypothetical protein